MPLVKLYNTSGLPVPKYETRHAAGMDACASEDTEILSGMVKPVPTGLFVEIPEGYEIQVRPRSGLSLKTKLRVANAPGTIDADYRGEIKVLLENTSMMPVSIKRGDRIAQLVLNQVPIINWDIVDSMECLSSTDRGANGFGSTGR